MTKTVSGIGLDENALRGVCERYSVARLALFGSFLRGEKREASDADLLVEFLPGQKPGFFGLADLQEELSSLLEGRKVDLRTPADLSERFRTDVTRSAKGLFAA